MDRTIKCEMTISSKRIGDLITTFVENGGLINWPRTVRFYLWDENNKKREVSYHDTWKEGSTFYDQHWSIDITVDEDPPKTYALGWRKLRWALERPDMKRHTADFIDENDDVETADALLQMAIFKEIVYG